MIFCKIFLMFHAISFLIFGVSTGGEETRWLGGSFFMDYRNKADRVGSGFKVCAEELAGWVI